MSITKKNKSDLKDYEKFLQSKMKRHIDSGFKITESELNPMLFDFQKFIVIFLPIELAETFVPASVFFDEGKLGELALGIHKVVQIHSIKRV